MNFNQLLPSHVTDIASIKADTIIVAEGCAMTVKNYLLADYDASPDGWNCLFEHPFDTVDLSAQTERRQIIADLL